MTPFTVYEVTGKPGHVLRVGSVSRADDAALQAGTGEATFIGQADAASQMIVDGAVVDRPASGLPASVEIAAGSPVLVDVPIGCKVKLAAEADWQPCDDGQVEVEMGTGEIMLVDVRPVWPVMEYRLTIHAD